MTFQLLEDGKQYWEVAKRYHTHRASGAVIKLAAVNDMMKLQPASTSKAVSKRIAKFISLHHKTSPSEPTGGGGPRYA